MKPLRRLPQIFKLVSVVACSFQILISSASPHAPLPQTELVLNEGSKLEVTSPGGNIAIVAGKGLARQYRWDDCSLDSKMHARTSRWLGNLGAYDPAARIGLLSAFFQYPSCKGVSRTVVAEGQMHFSDIEAAEEWIRHRPKSWINVWTNDGLVVSWLIKPAQSKGVAIGNISLDLVLVCINGLRPTKLEGASDQAIRLTHASVPNQAIHQCAKVGSDVIKETQRDLARERKSYGS